MTTSTMGGTFSGRGYLGVSMILGLMAVTIYMAFGFPYTLFHLKQTETSEIQSVIIVGRNGESSPSPDSYFIGEEAPEELHKIGYNELTNTGKERMYFLGKFLKLRYYHLLLNGDPRKIYARAASSDRHLESAQALLAGLNPPRDEWSWSSTNELSNWQPKAVHSTESEHDDLLSVESNCFKLEQDKLIWKNSTRYQQLLNEFRHDLQTLRANTGLEFEDDLEMLSDIEDALKTRKAFRENVPAWYTSTFANRLDHIADVTTESRFNSASVQRLYVGRLLHEITERINTRILIHRQTLAESEQPDGGRHEFPSSDESSSWLVKKREPQLLVQQTVSSDKIGNMNEPNMFVYITDKDRLAALMSSLQIYSSEPRFGSLLLIELHFDPINKVHFLRLFTVSSSSPNSFPEPLRVNPIACIDSIECAPQQFEQNIRHLMLDKASWQEACLSSDSKPPSSWTTVAPLLPLINDDLSNQTIQEMPVSPGTSTNPTETSIAPVELVPTAAEKPSDEPQVVPAGDKLEEGLIVGPTQETKPTENPLDAVTQPNALPIDSILPDNPNQPVIEQPSKVVLENDAKSTVPHNDSITKGEPGEPTMGEKKQDITSAIEFQSSPNEYPSDSFDLGENHIDVRGGQETQAITDGRQIGNSNNNHFSDI